MAPGAPQGHQLLCRYQAQTAQTTGDQLQPLLDLAFERVESF